MLAGQTPGRTAATLQLARAATLPERAASAPFRTAALEAFRQRNAALDSFFYDVGVVTETEAQAVAPWLAAEGAILRVPPTGQGPLTIHAGVEAFIEAGGAAITALAVAGVGSSALGSAAFARNCADALGAPVAAVVSGYGLADLAAEAMGGWFLFGALNGLRHAFEPADRLTERGIIAAPPVGAAFDPARSRDTLTVLALLTDPRLSFDLAIGHSKGNLVISEALYDLCRADLTAARHLGARLRIITVSARVAMPDVCRTVFDIAGALDWLAALNSRPDIANDLTVPAAWHHTNTALPFHFPVTPAIRTALDRLGLMQAGTPS